MKLWSARLDAHASPTAASNEFATAENDTGNPPALREVGRRHASEEMRFRDPDAILTFLSCFSLTVCPFFSDEKGEIPRVESGTNAHFAIRCASKKFVGPNSLIGGAVGPPSDEK